MTVLLTGATGFVGQNLMLALSESGFTVNSVSRLELSDGNFDKLDNCDSIIHLAGKAHDLKNSSDPDAYEEVNYKLTKNIFDAFLKSNARKFIFMSSVKASADKVDSILTEEDKPAPQTDYGISKLKAEKYIQSATLPEGKSYYILRPCMIHGPGNKGNLNLLYKFIVKGIPYPLASFDNRRSFLSIGNLCFVVEELLKRVDIDSGIYQLADDETLSTNDLIALMSQTLDLPIRFLNINKTVVNAIAKIGDLVKLPLDTHRLKKLTENYLVDNTKIKSALGKKFPIHAREGLIKTVKSFRKPE